MMFVIPVRRMGIGKMNVLRKRSSRKLKVLRSVAPAETDCNSEEDLALVVNNQSHYTDVWVLDTGASYHISSCME